ncbi:low affinity sulfate transporter 3-like isoform X1 [Tripterygium wilfordii]|uniref:Low affinity sulfate transporter 3-like isoform X1 n=1 Tax=Tripterygium wilfordii TaxID=458696 RepID=A0A7J7D062_TRIWF|nr:low affinity sulfate transporter 3-like isoform X1 [Tripterygium wilfordii]
MGTLHSENFSAFNVEQRQQLDTDYTNRLERAQWLLNSPEPPHLWQKVIGSVKQTIFPHKNRTTAKQSRRKSVVSFLKGFFPVLIWGRNYNASKFKNDLMAGLTLASLSIPQSIGYANLAKLDPQYGLYTSVVPPLIYSLMGSSREIAIGPVAVVSLLLSSTIQKIQDPFVDPVAYRKLVFTVTFFAGIFQAMFGLFRLGFLVEFLSHAAIVGFMGGAAIIIGLQQLKGLLAISHFSTKTDVISVLESVFRSIKHDTWYPLNFALGCSFLIFLLIARFVGKRNKKLFWIPAIAPLISVILSTAIVFLTKAEQHGVVIVKHLKGGLNPSSVHQLQFKGAHVGFAAKTGLIAAIVALAVIISFAKILLNAIRPGVEAIGRLPRTDIFCDTEQYPNAIETPGILIFRVNSSLICFANANFVRERIMSLATEDEDDHKENGKGKTGAVILDMSSKFHWLYRLKITKSYIGLE